MKKTRILLVLVIIFACYYFRKELYDLVSTYGAFIIPALLLLWIGGFVPPAYKKIGFRGLTLLYLVPIIGKVETCYDREFYVIGIFPIWGFGDFFKTLIDFRWLGISYLLSPIIAYLWIILYE